MPNVFHFIQAGGIMMIPLLLISFAAVAIIVERWMTYREICTTPFNLVQKVIVLTEAERYDEAQRTCDGKTGPVAASMAAVLRHRRLGAANVERKVQEVGEGYFMRLEKYLPVLDTTTTVSPLLGLLGTLIGMIGIFQAVAASKDQAANDRMLAGIGEALYATATGLTIAVICFVAFNAFAARQRAIVAETEQAVTRLMNSLIAHGEMADQRDVKHAV